LEKGFALADFTLNEPPDKNLTASLDTPFAKLVQLWNEPHLILEKGKIGLAELVRRRAKFDQEAASAISEIARVSPAAAIRKSMYNKLCFTDIVRRHGVVPMVAGAGW
jgi:hypothetical protein